MVDPWETTAEERANPIVAWVLGASAEQLAQIERDVELGRLYAGDVDAEIAARR